MKYHQHFYNKWILYTHGNRTILISVISRLYFKIFWEILEIENEFKISITDQNGNKSYKTMHFILNSFFCILVENHFKIEMTMLMFAFWKRYDCKRLSVYNNFIFLCLENKRLYCSKRRLHRSCKPQSELNAALHWMKLLMKKKYFTVLKCFMRITIILLFFIYLLIY